ncbi:MAG TPA: DUF3617 family protein [Steroidobacteraceae bacterium]
MNKTIGIALMGLGLSAGLVAAQGLQPLKVKTGLWQMTQSVTWSGAPPQYAAAFRNGQHNYKSCVKAKDLGTNPWADGAGVKCTWSVLSSTGTDMEVKGTSCDFGKEYRMTADVHGKIHVVDSENGTGSQDIILNGNGLVVTGHATYTGKWIGASCPANSD